MKKKNKIITLLTFLFIFNIFFTNKCYAQEKKDNPCGNFTYLKLTTGDYIPGYGKWAENLYGYLLNDFQQMGININKDDIISVTSSDKNIIKINSKKTEFKAQDAGFAYLTIKVRETEQYKGFDYRIPILVFPPNTQGISMSGIPNGKIKIVDGLAFKQTKKHTFMFTFFLGPSSHCFVGNKTKSRVEISTDKNFKNIVKKYTLTPKYFNKKNYKKINNITIYSNEYIWEKFKITKNWNIKYYNSNKNNFGQKKLNKNKDVNYIFKLYGFDIDNYFSLQEFDNLYKK